MTVIGGIGQDSEPLGDLYSCGVRDWCVAFILYTGLDPARASRRGYRDKDTRI